MWNITFLITGLVFILLLIGVFFSKKAVMSNENKSFKYVLIVTVSAFIIELLLQVIVKSYGVDVLIVDILARIYLLILLLWYMIFSIYVSFVSTSKKKSNMIFNIIIVAVFVVGIFAVANLAIFKYYDNSKMYTYGPAVDSLKYFIGFYILLWVILLWKSPTKLINKQYFPIYANIVLLIVSTIIQSIDPSILIASMVGTFVCYIMYFTIENPDVKMLEEFRIAKDRAEKANEEKEIFLYDITQDIRMPLYDIRKASSWLDTNADSMTKNSIHDGMHYIQNKTTNVLDKVNNVLDISNMELTNIKIYENKYDINNLVSYLKKTYKSSEDVEIKYMVDSNIPTSLYGDVLRLKQLISILMDNAVKYTSSGTVFFKLNAINRKEITRLIITVEDTGVGIKASDIDNIFNKENRLYNNLDKIDDNKKNLAIAKSIASLLGGVLLLESEIGKGTKITLVIDQLIYKEQSKELDKLEEDTVKYVDKKKVLVVIEDDEYLAKIKSKLKKYDMEVEYVDKGAKCLDKIRLKNKYHLIIMDEQLKYLSSLEILNRLKKVTNFNIPVCLLTDNIENDNFIKDGFTYLLDRKLDRKSLDSLFEEIEK